MNLYPYQKKIFDVAMDSLKSSNRLMIVVPTGGGKTVIFSHLIKKLEVKTLVIAHTKELISQCVRTLDRMNIQGIDVWTIQKFGMRFKQKKLKEYDLIIIDECHRSGAETYEKLVNRYVNSKIVGVTATPFRSDGKKLIEIFGQKICPLSLLDMIEQGLLSDFEGYRVTTNCSLRGISTQKGDFVSSKLSAVINVKQRNELIVKEYTKIAVGEKCLCFAVDIKHSNELEKQFVLSGISAKSIHGKIPDLQRKKMIQDFSTGKIQVMINCNILTEGFDDPSITCLLMARPTKSKTLYTQMIGRGSRLFPGKNKCKVLEFTDNDYDVSCLEDLVNNKDKKNKIERGECLSAFASRSKILGDSTGETFVEKLEIVPKSIYEKDASEWQKSYLKSLKINFQDPLTEIRATQLITMATNGNN